MRVLLEITKFHLHKSVPAEGIIRVAGIIRGRALYEEIRYSVQNNLLFNPIYSNPTLQMLTDNSVSSVVES